MIFKTTKMNKVAIEFKCGHSIINRFFCPGSGLPYYSSHFFQFLPDLFRKTCNVSVHVPSLITLNCRCHIDRLMTSGLI